MEWTSDLLDYFSEVKCVSMVKAGNDGNEFLEQDLAC